MSEDPDRALATAPSPARAGPTAPESVPGRSASGGERQRAAVAAIKKVTYLNVAVNGSIGVLKGAAGLFSGSSAMLADAVHSFSDLLSDLIVLGSMWLARKPADAEHPYGHGRFETLGTVVLAVMLLFAAGGLVWNAIADLGRESLPGTFAIWAASISILTKEGLYQVTVRVGRRYRSSVVVANAWHSRVDAISSIAALAGIIGARLGFPILDPVAAIVIAALITRVAVRFVADAIREVTDTALEREMCEEIARDLGKLAGVVNVHGLRARRMGPTVLVDLHVEVDGSTTVSDGHQVAERVRRHLLDRYEQVSEVLVHIDPEPDQCDQEIYVARPRAELEAEVRRAADAVDGVRRVTHVLAHYLRRHVGVQVHIEVDPALRIADANEIARRLREAIQRIDGIDHTDVHLELDDRAHRELPTELESLRPSSEREAAEEPPVDEG